MGRINGAPPLSDTSPVENTRRPASVVISSYFLTSKGFRQRKNDGMPLPPPQGEGEEEPNMAIIMRKVSRLLMPVCFLAGMLNYLDRTNLNFAALQLNAELGFTPSDYGLGAGFFSLGYGLAHVPSTFVTMRIGARWWYSSITIIWGIVATLGVLIHNRASLCVQRFFLGVAEAGAIPSALHLMSQFYPVSMRTKPFTAVTLANVLSVVVAAPLAAGLMSMNGLGGLRGWQWLFIVEGLPSVLLGLIMMAILPSHPLSAWVLTQAERLHLHHKVHEGNTEAATAAKEPMAWKLMWTLTVEALKMPLLWFFSLAGFLWVLCVWSLNTWMPIIIKNMLAGTALTGSTSSGGTSSVNTLHATLLSAIPYFCAAMGMVVMAWSSARHSERTLHVGIPCIFGGIILCCFRPLMTVAIQAGFAVIVIAMTCAYSGQGVMYARVAESLDTKHAGVGLALFNASGAAIGGFCGPWIVGSLVGRLGSFVPAMVFMGVFLMTTGIAVTAFGAWEFYHKRKQAKLHAEANSFAAASHPDSKSVDSKAACLAPGVAMSGDAKV